MQGFRKDLGIPGLIALIYEYMKSIPDTKRRNNGYTLPDYLMSCFAMFHLKYPSLLQFDQDFRLDDNKKSNLKNLYKINKVPSDTAMRVELDAVDPELIRVLFKKILSVAQRGKVLADFEFHDGSYLLSIDGTGYFSSNSIHCEQCCEKHHRNGDITYHHQLLAVVLIHPDQSTVLPLCPEPIMKQDGAVKNDCELESGKRLLPQIRKAHPRASFIVVQDALASNAPYIRELKRYDFQFILGVKESSHTWLFYQFRESNFKTYEKVDSDGTKHSFQYARDIPLNESNEDLRVNVVKYTEEKPGKKPKTFVWITDLKVTEHTLFKIMKGGRGRWKIENETFNTLKNKGYNFEHNFGHGYKHLSTVMAFMMLLAFLVDQIVEHTCGLFEQVMAKVKRKSYLWRKIRTLFDEFYINNWRDLYFHMKSKEKVPMPQAP